MNEVISERNIAELKPEMRVLEDINQIIVVPDQTTILAKVDGEFSLLSYTKDAETYLLNQWGRCREDFPALNEFAETMKKTSITHVELLCELHAQENGKPTNLPRFIHLLKGEKDLTKIHIAIWDLIKIDNYEPKEEPFAWKLEEVEKWLNGSTHPHISVAPYIKPKDQQEIKDFWLNMVQGKGYEGLVIRNGDEVCKLKPCLDVDAVIIGLNKTSSNGKHLSALQEGRVTSMKLALMQPDGTFIELCDCASGITQEIGAALFKLNEYKIGEDNNTIYVKPIVICTIEYTDTFSKQKRTLKFDGTKYADAAAVEFVSLRHPRLKRFRPDKTVNPEDLRLTQVSTGKPLEFHLHCGDNRKILPTLADASIDLIITSPPYWRQAQYDGIEGEIGTKQNQVEYRVSMLTILKQCYRILKPNGVLMLNMDNGRREDCIITCPAWEWIEPLQKLGFNLVQTIIWVDRTRRPLTTAGLLDHDYEPIFILAKGKDYTWNLQETKHHGDVWEITHYKGYAEEKGDQWDRTGVASFPVTLIEDLIRLGSHAGDWTLDIFAGSGTVMDCSQRLGRNNISIEISENYCQTIVSRCFDKEKLHKYTLAKEAY